MDRRRKIQRAREFERHIGAKQRNILFEDTVGNARGIDHVFWNGPSNGSMVQRIGALLIAFALFGTSVLVMALGHDIAFYLFGGIGAAAALRIAYMAVRRKKS